ncbi:MAG: hypothetical protein GF334_05140 [Candidatus Altiarchaeales archaeon]|nr:hypothetical protein [Candidatus Altiarchaeales archaeon]
MTQIARFLCDKDYILRSGAAVGADAAFEAGVCRGCMKEIYLPWKGFNLHHSNLYNISSEAYALAAEFHPAWGKLSNGPRELIARNGYQVLGYDLHTPSDFVVCWTPKGKTVGGTGQAIRIAQAHGIPVFNLGRDKDLDFLKECIKTNQIFISK